MAVKTRATISSEIEANIETNTTRAITAADVRTRLDDIADSAFMAEDVGVSIQAFHANLTAISGLTTASFGLDFLTYDDAAEAKTALALVKSDVGLGNVPNVDATDRDNHTGSQAISTVTGLQTALDAKAALSGATFTGAVAGTTASFQSITANAGAISLDRTGDSAAAQVVVSRDSGQVGDLLFRTGTANRWLLRAAADDDLDLFAYNDAGTVATSALNVARSTQIVTFNQSPIVPTPAADDDSTKVATTAFWNDRMARAGTGYMLDLGTDEVDVKSVGGRLLLGAAATALPGSTNPVNGATWMGEIGNLYYLERATLVTAIHEFGGCGVVGATRASDRYFYNGSHRPYWTTATSYTTGDIVGSRGKIYQAASTGTSGGTNPTHTTGTQSDGGVDWTILQFSYAASIGLAAYVECDVADGQGAWAAYIEARRTVNSTVFGIELDIANDSATDTDSTPYDIFAGTSGGATIGLGIVPHKSGTEDVNNPSSAAILIYSFNSDDSGATQGNSSFNAGIVFSEFAITGADGSGAGVGDAILMAKGHALTWHTPSDDLGARIYSTVDTTTLGVSMVFDDNQVLFTRDGVAMGAFTFLDGSSAVAANLSLGANSTGNNARLLAGGSDTNVGISIVPKGTGDVRVIQTDAGATAGPFLILERISASPAASDVLGLIQWLGRDSGGASQSYGDIFVLVTDPTASSEDATMQIRTVQAGTVAARGVFGGGFYHPSATGTDKGNNTINFGSVYDDNVLLTDYVFDKWLGDEGEYTDRVQAKYDALDVSMFDPKTYAEYFRVERRLWGMPDQDDVIDGLVKEVSLGGMCHLLWQTAELNAIHVAAVNDNVDDLKAQVAALNERIAILEAA